MQISYEEFKLFAYDLNRFVKERECETLRVRTQAYIEKNVTVDVPDCLYTAVRNYKANYIGLVDTLAELTEPKSKHRRKCCEK